MSLILPDPRLEAPELMYPGRKPAGPVKIDWDNPITEGLRVCWIGQDGTPFDHAGGHILGTNGAAPMAQDRQGLVKFYSDDGALVYDPIVTSEYLGPNGSDHTFLFGLKNPAITNANTHYCIAHADGVNTGLRIRISGSGVPPNQFTGIVLTYGGVADYGGSGNVGEVNTKIVQMGFSATIGSDYDYVGNGEFNNNISVGSVKPNSSPLVFFGRSTTTGFQGTCSYGFYWVRRLRESECKTMYDDPYNFLVPA